jgi:hypothetical protein
MRAAPTSEDDQCREASMPNNNPKTPRKKQPEEVEVTLTKWLWIMTLMMALNDDDEVVKHSPGS